MIIVGWIIEVLFRSLCGWVGHAVVKALSVGRIDLEWSDGPESVLAGWLGFFFLLGVAVLIAWFIRN